MVTTLTLTFANVLTTAIEYGSLADGRWQLAIPYLSYTSPLNDVNLRRLFGDVDSNGTVQASDALRILRAAVGQAVSCPPSICDVDASGRVQSSDSLKALKKAVGQAVTLACPDA